MSQKERIVAYCKQHGSITVADMAAMHINSPTRRISDLREDGRHRVDSIDEPVLDDDGKQRSHYSRYYIKEVG